MKRAIYFSLLASTLSILFGCAQDSPSKETVKDSEERPLTDESSEENGLEQGISQVAEGYATVLEEGDTINSDMEKEIYLYMKSLYSDGKAEGQNTQGSITKKTSKKYGITQEQADMIYLQYEMQLYKPK